MTTHPKTTLPRALQHGLLGRCPNCGSGSLFRAYLKPVAECAHCAEPLGRIRADDGPAWLTIIIVGHIVVPLLMIVQQRTDWPDWVAMLFWSCISLALVLFFLPRTKGAFIAIIWKTKGFGYEAHSASAPDR